MNIIDGIEYAPVGESEGPFALLANNGETHRFYSGRAGDLWLTGKPFTYRSREEAARKAGNFNRMVKIHGFWFMVVGVK